MVLLRKVRDYYFYSRKFHKIKTKLDGIQPFIIRDYQKRFIDFIQDINGPKRVIALKPRQAGFSTLCASYFSWLFATKRNYSGLLMADKKDRTQEVAGIYHLFLENLPQKMTPMVSVRNSEKLWLNNPKVEDRKKNPGLNSGVVFETGQDPNAGRSASRQWAHLTEWAFVPYCNEIDEGVQNSIPLDPTTMIIKESTANGRAGAGKPFYDLWNAAKRGESIYKPFFVAWYEIDDYQIHPPRGFQPTKWEREVLKLHPKVTEANLYWRRLKVLEYNSDDEQTILTPEERFKQDFPLNDEEAFLSTGAPVFDIEKVNRLINILNSNRPAELQERVRPKGAVISQFLHCLTIYKPPREGLEYFIGADVAEGLELGDASSVCVLDQNGAQAAKWHGKIDSDLFGHLLIDLGRFYNEALIIPENNNMGIQTVTTIRNNNYPRIYKEMVEDKVEKKRIERFGWRTTSRSKMLALSEGIRSVRDGTGQILDVRLLEEMAGLSREANGNVNLNGKDRVVAYCLTLVGLRQYYSPRPVKRAKPRRISGPASEIHEAWERSRKDRNTKDIFS